MPNSFEKSKIEKRLTTNHVSYEIEIDGVESPEISNIKVLINEIISQISSNSQNKKSDFVEMARKSNNPYIKLIGCCAYNSADSQGKEVLINWCLYQAKDQPIDPSILSQIVDFLYLEKLPNLITNKGNIDEDVHLEYYPTTEDEAEIKNHHRRCIIKARRNILPKPIYTDISDIDPENPKQLLDLIKTLAINPNPNSPIKICSIIVKTNGITRILLKSDDTDRYENGSPKDNFNIRECAIILNIQKNGEISVQQAAIKTTFDDWDIPGLEINHHLNAFDENQPWGKIFFKELKQYGVDTGCIVINENTLEFIQNIPDYI